MISGAAALYCAARTIGKRTAEGLVPKMPSSFGVLSSFNRLARTSPLRGSMLLGCKTCRRRKFQRLLFETFCARIVGDREVGDAYVLATLETVVAEPSRITDSDDLRIAVYRLFLDVWAASPINAHTDRSGALSENGRRNLDAISLKPRVAFLLQALEGFDLDQIT
jgi:hypothetical protein